MLRRPLDFTDIRLHWRGRENFLSMAERIDYCSKFRLTHGHREAHTRGAGKEREGEASEALHLLHIIISSLIFIKYVKEERRRC
jgi:hypothetical protein